MNATLDAPPATLGDFLREMHDRLHALGDIPPDRVRMNPRPGTATIDDLLKPENDGCELIDGTLVERAMGVRESALALFLGQLLGPVVRGSNLGILTGADGTFEMLSGLVRLPDVAFVSWDRLPGRRLPEEPVPNVVPDLAIEVVSARNTRAELARKRQEYFTAGVRLVWEINPRTRTVIEYTADDAGRPVTDALDGGPVLPGFRVPLADLFAELDRHG